MGVLSREDLDRYCKPNGCLGCHPDYGNPGIEASTGALGHGLSMVVGMALAERGRKTDGTIYTVTQGQTFASTFKLVTINGTCASFLNGDQSFSLCETANK